MVCHTASRLRFAVDHHSYCCDKARWARDAVELPREQCGGCSTIELRRHMEPATGVEPITRDNPQLRPIEISERARSDLDSTVALPIELFASKREGGFEPPTYGVR